ncbi:MAG: sigma-54 dependent transcriptional regulator, partial [Calditrichota bacterium]
MSLQESALKFREGTHPYRILAVDSWNKITPLLQSKLNTSVVIEKATTADTALQMLALASFHLVIVQLKLRLFSGLDLVRKIKKVKPDLPVITLAPSTMAEESAEVFRLGYPPPIEYPGGEDDLVERCREYLSAEKWYRSIDWLKTELQRRYGFNELLSVTPVLEQVYERLVKINRSRVPILITGASGTGKELIARLIHRTSDRNKKPFLVTNCAAIPEGLLESQFFGHEKGAYTGAVNRVPGKFELAHTGTLFLDEIGEMRPALQAKLLRVIEYGEFERVGGTERQVVDVRLITASNRDLQDLVKTGDFRSDLFYRINVFPIYLPPLHERGEDVILLTYHFLKLAGTRNNRQVRIIHQDVEKLLHRYPWPGNARELENAVERALLLSDGIRLHPQDFPQQLEWCDHNPEEDEDDEDRMIDPQSIDSIRPLKEMESEAIQQALHLTKNRISLAARRLGISRNTL